MQIRVPVRHGPSVEEIVGEVLTAEGLYDVNRCQGFLRERRQFPCGRSLRARSRLDRPHEPVHDDVDDRRYQHDGDERQAPSSGGFPEKLPSSSSSRRQASSPERQASSDKPQAASCKMLDPS